MPPIVTLLWITLVVFLWVAITAGIWAFLYAGDEFPPASQATTNE